MDEKTYRLVLHGSPRYGSVYYQELTPYVDRWRRSTRIQGGYWLGSFAMMEGYGGMSAGQLADVFYGCLGSEIREYSGGAMTWQGMIYEMDFTYKGRTRRRSFDFLTNHVRATYIDSTGNTVHISDAATNDSSIVDYGRKEELLSLDGFPQASAESFRNSYLLENAWPWQRTVSAVLDPEKMDEPALLEVTTSGYIFTANWRYESGGTGDSAYIHDWIDQIVSTDCEFLTAGSVASNTTLTIYRETKTPQRAYDVIQDLVGLGDTNNNLYRFYVSNDRVVNYVTLSNVPNYVVHRGEIRSSVGTPFKENPWSIQPGVYRDLDYAFPRPEFDSWFQDARDFLVQEVEVSQDGIVLKTEEVDETEILAAQNEYQRWLERLQKQKEQEREKKKKEREKEKDKYKIVI